MSIAKKIRSIITMLFSLALLAAMLAGLYGSLWARAEAQQAVDRATQTADHSLARTQGELDQARRQVQGLEQGVDQLAAGLQGAAARVQENPVGRAASRVLDIDGIVTPIVQPLQRISAQLSALSDQLARLSATTGQAQAGLPALYTRISIGLTVLAAILALLFLYKSISRMAQFLRALAALIGLELQRQPPLPALAPPAPATAPAPPVTVGVSQVVVVAPQIVVSAPAPVAPAWPAAAPALRLAPAPEAVVAPSPVGQPARSAAPSSTWEQRWEAWRSRATKPLPDQPAPSEPLNPAPPWEASSTTPGDSEGRPTTRLPETF